jgi:hypothetical protein
MAPTVIVAAASIREFFEEAVAAALDHRALAPAQATSTYLVDLLSDFTLVQELALDQALAVVMAEARLAPPGESVAAFKRVGDNSLYLAGYFGDSLRRAELDVGYYVGLGGEAYRAAAITLERIGTSSQLVVVFAELGEEFARFVEVLEDIRGAAPDLAVGDLYEEWLRTRSTGTARRLQASGLRVDRPPKKA